MRLRAAWLRYWFGAVLIGIAAAVIAGLLATMPPTAMSAFEENNYLGHCLYATAAKILVANIDRWVPPAVGLALLLAALITVGRLGRGYARLFLRFGLPLLTLGPLVIAHFIRHRSHWSLLLKGAKSATDFCAPLFHNPFSLLLPLAVLAWVEWRIVQARRPRKAAITREAQGERTARALARVTMLFGLCRRIARFLAFAAVGLLVVLFTFLHVARVFFNRQIPVALRDKPNIIFIMVDTLRVDHVGCYGYDLPTTPNIDRFAATSTRFERAIAPSSWTVWSVHSLFTSQYPDVLFHSHDAVFQQLKLQAESIDLSPRNGAPLYFTTMAEVFRDRGYSTNAVISNPWLSVSPGNTQGYDHYDDSPTMLNRECQETSPDVTEKAIDRLRQVKDERFFMYLVYMDPHDPYYQNPGFSFGDSQHDKRIEAAIAGSVPPEQLAERRADLRRYNSEIAYTDHAVGQFLKELKAQGLYDDALIVFFGDHGEEFREHGGTNHEKTVYNEVISVPLIIKFPRQQQGRFVEGSFPLIDLFPSLMQILRYPADHLGLRGDAVDLTTLLRCGDKPIFSATTTSARCVTEGQRKYLDWERPEKKQRYFDLAADPLEQHDLLARRPAAANGLIASFKKWNEQNALLEVQQVATPDERERLLKQKPDNSEQQALIEQLKGLGYLK